MRYSSRRSTTFRFLVLAGLSFVGTGCASLAEQGIRSLVGDDGPGSGTPRSSARGADRAPAVTSVYQHGATFDWVRAQTAPFTPAYSVASRVAPDWLRCKPVPVGFTQVFSGPTGPATSSLVSFGPVRVSMGGPDGVVGDAFETDPEVLGARALFAGARLAGHGPTCTNRFHFFTVIGGEPDEISVLR